MAGKSVTVLTTSTVASRDYASADDVLVDATGHLIVKGTNSHGFDERLAVFAPGAWLHAEVTEAR